jgi:hypothetical protein
MAYIYQFKQLRYYKAQNMYISFHSFLLLILRACATSIESLLKYPCGDKLTLFARTSSSSSDFGSRPIQTRKSGLLGNGALMVPLPAFLPSVLARLANAGQATLPFDMYRLFLATLTPFPVFQHIHYCLLWRTGQLRNRRSRLMPRTSSRNCTTS